MAQKLSTDQWKVKAELVHGKNRYDYSESIYNGSTKKIKIICHEKDETGKEHGPFFQNAGNHLQGQGCPICSEIRRINANKSRAKTTKQFIKEAQEVHGNKYDYSKVIYKTKTTPVTIICPKHGPFNVRPDNHIFLKSGCPKCYTDKQLNATTKTTEQFIKEAQEVHGNKYDYSITKYFRSKDYVDIICPEHGPFQQIPNAHLTGQGCPICGRLSQINKRRKTEFDFIKEAQQIHQNIDGTPKYLYNKTNYSMCHDHVIITCPKHGDFEQRPDKHLQGQGCPLCRSNSISIEEKEIREILDSNNIEYIINDREILKPQELDIYIPSLKLGIEFDGIYWHSNKFKSNNYHLQKTLAAENKGIQLIHIFENEWLLNKEIVKSRILNLIGKTKFKLGARKCIIKQVPVEEERNFLNNNHLQGYTASKICYGLYWKFNDKLFLVSLMSFGETRFNSKYHWELLRFCNAKNFNIIGAGQKLFKHFIKIFNPDNIVSYADRRWSTSIKPNIYDKLGFELINKSEPGYFYVNGLKLENRLKYTKSECKKLGCPDSITEKDFVTNILGLDIIYDSGQLVYVWSKPNNTSNQPV